MKFLKFSITLCFLLVCMTAFATDWHVATTGTNSSSCGTSSAPCATISYVATNKVAAGDTVYVASGTYNEAVVINKSGTSSAPIKFVSNTKWGAKLVSSGASGNYGFEVFGSYVTIDGFDISGGTSATATFEGIRLDGTGGVGASYDTIIRNHIHDIRPPCGTSAMGVDDTYYYLNTTDYYAKSRYNTITDNIINDVGSDPACSTHRGYGIYVSTYKPTITNNLIFNEPQYGIHTWHAASFVTIANNTIVNIGVDSGNGVGIEVGDGDAPGGTVATATVDGTSYSGVNTDGSGHPVVNQDGYIVNNIVKDAQVYGIQEFCYANTTVCTLNNHYLNNDVFSSGSANWSLKNGTQTASMSSDPLFMADTRTFSTMDYSLQNSPTPSPAIDAGTSSNAPTTDINGNARPSGSAYDMGAYEFVVTTGGGGGGSGDGTYVPGDTTVIRTASADPANCSDLAGEMYFNTTTHTIRACNAGNTFINVAYKVADATATLSFSNVTAPGSASLTVSVPGAVVGDVVALGIPNASATALGVYEAWVSAANTVTVRYYALQSGQPASGSFKVMVFR